MQGFIGQEEDGERRGWAGEGQGRGDGGAYRGPAAEDQVDYRSRGSGRVQ